MRAFDVAYINPFIAAADGVFDTMIKSPLSLGKPRLLGDPSEVTRQFGVATQIALSGELDGVVLLSLSRPVALSLASGFAGAPFKELDADAMDALREIASIIVGRAREGLPKGGLTMSLPKVMDRSAVHFGGDAPVLVIPFDSGAGRFVIETSFRRAG